MLRWLAVALSKFDAKVLVASSSLVYAVGGQCWFEMRRVVVGAEVVIVVIVINIMGSWSSRVT